MAFVEIVMLNINYERFPMRASSNAACGGSRERRAHCSLGTSLKVRAQCVSMVNSCVLFANCLKCYVKSALCLAYQRQQMPCGYVFVLVHL